MNQGPSLKSERDLFVAASKLTNKADRAAFLADACSDHPDLVRRVEALLDAQGGSGLLRRAVEANERSTPNAARSATAGNMTCGFDLTQRPVIDRYELLEELGQGGMGTVYLASQTEPVRRRVAVKVINPGMDTREVIARFDAERQALALMDHPNIASVFDGGMTETGLPYFAMELVRGVNVVEYCRDNCVRLRRKLRLFVDVCSAVQHAHQKGILHRDLKPANVLVTSHNDRPVVKVIDFGVAKALNANLTDQTLLTQHSTVIGTPLYMSPEQACAGSVDVDTRSDIYSLGVILFELLTGTTPFDTKTTARREFDEFRKVLLEEDPAPPSVRVKALQVAASTKSGDSGVKNGMELSRELHGELDWIVMKALSRERDERYETASALAEDVRRFLCHEPVTARPASVLYRLRKLARRHRVAFTSTLILVATLIGSSAVAINQAFRATRAEGRATTNYEKLKSSFRTVDQLRGEAVQSASRARRLLVDAQLAEATRQFREADASGLLSFLAARQNAEGDAALERHTSELWTVANSLLPSRVEYMIGDSDATALSPAGLHLAWVNSTGVTVRDLAQNSSRRLDTSRLWNPQGTHRSRVQLLFSPDGSRLVLSRAGTVLIWDVVTGQNTTVIAHSESEAQTAPKATVALSPTGNLVATLDGNSTLRLWRLPEGVQAGSSLELKHRPEIFSFDQTGKWLILDGMHTSRHISRPCTMSLRVESLLAADRDPYQGSVTTAHDVPDGERTLVAHGNILIARKSPSSASVSEVTSAEAGFSIRSNSPITAADVSVFDLLAVGNANGAATLWSLDEKRTFGPTLQHGGPLAGICFDPSGSFLATAGSDGVLQFWQVTRPILSLVRIPQCRAVQSLCSDRSRGWVLTRSESNMGKSSATLRRFPEYAGRQIAVLPVGTTDLQIQPGTNRFLTLIRKQPQVALVDETGQVIWHQPGSTGTPGRTSSFRLHPDSSRVVTMEHGEGQDWCHVWDVNTQETIACWKFLSGEPALIGGFLNLGRDLLVATEDALHVYDLQSGALLHQQPVASRPTAIAVARDGSSFFVGDETGVVRRHLTHDYAPTGPSLRLDARVLELAITGDGMWLASVDGTLGTPLHLTYLGDASKWRTVRALLPDSPRDLHAIDQRKFLYRDPANKARVLRLPAAEISIAVAAANTHRALGVRLDDSGLPQALTPDQWAALKPEATHRNP